MTKNGRQVLLARLHLDWSVFLWGRVKNSAIRPMEYFALRSGIDSRAFSQYYVAYNSKAKEVATASKPFTQIQKTNPASAEKLKAFPATKGFDDSKVGFLPFYFTLSPQRRHDRHLRPRNRQHPRYCACCAVNAASQTRLVALRIQACRAFTHRKSFSNRIPMHRAIGC
jgi:hypothetical protein